MYGLSTETFIQTVSPNTNSFKSNTEESFLSPSCCFLTGSLDLLVFNKDLTFTGTGGIFILNPNSSQLKNRGYKE